MSCMSSENTAETCLWRRSYADDRRTYGDRWVQSAIDRHALQVSVVTKKKNGCRTHGQKKRVKNTGTKKQAQSTGTKKQRGQTNKHCAQHSSDALPCFFQSARAHRLDVANCMKRRERKEKAINSVAVLMATTYCLSYGGFDARSGRADTLAPTVIPDGACNTSDLGPAPQNPATEADRSPAAFIDRRVRTDNRQRSPYGRRHGRVSIAWAHPPGP